MILVRDKPILRREIGKYRVLLFGKNKSKGYTQYEVRVRREGEIIRQDYFDKIKDARKLFNEVVLASENN